MEEECEDGEYDLACENARLIVENERLRKLVEEAYREGFSDEWTFFDEDFDVEVENGWNLSQSRAALQPQPKEEA